MSNGQTLALSVQRGHCTARRLSGGAKLLRIVQAAYPVTPNILRHVCGFALADKEADTRLIHDYLSICVGSQLTAVQSNKHKGTSNNQNFRL